MSRSSATTPSRSRSRPRPRRVRPSLVPKKRFFPQPPRCANPPITTQRRVPHAENPRAKSASASFARTSSSVHGRRSSHAPVSRRARRSDILASIPTPALAAPARASRADAPARESRVRARRRRSSRRRASERPRRRVMKHDGRPTNATDEISRLGARVSPSRNARRVAESRATARVARHPPRVSRRSGRIDERWSRT